MSDNKPLIVGMTFVGFGTVNKDTGEVESVQPLPQPDAVPYRITHSTNETIELPESAQFTWRMKLTNQQMRMLLRMFHRHTAHWAVAPLRYAIKPAHRELVATPTGFRVYLSRRGRIVRIGTSRIQENRLADKR